MDYNIIPIMLESSGKSVKELEEELTIMKMLRKNGFDMHDKEIKDIKTRATQYSKNTKILEQFSYWLVMRGIDLSICNTYERSILFKIFNKEQVPLSRTQTERNVMKETISRSYFE